MEQALHRIAPWQPPTPRLRRTNAASVNLGARAIAPAGGGASEERGLQFFAFDTAYVERLQAGDAPTEEHFVRYFSELLLLKLRSRLSSKEAIEDVRQETFTRVFVILRKERGLKQPDRLGAFVNSVCNHVLMEHYRSRSRNDSGIENEHGEAFIHRGPSALKELETKDTQRVVRQILKDLTPRDRLLLQSVLLDERDKDEVCAEFGITREYLRVLLHRAKQSFKSFYISRLGETRMY
jgi:RNA polymerase sigma-70 factor (ECF subfamily)